MRICLQKKVIHDIVILIQILKSGVILKMKFTAAGDAIIQRRIYKDYKGYEELAPFIKQGDARFFNLETTLNYEGEACGSEFSGGTYIRTSPEVLDDIKAFGFNMTSFNNNHALDFSYAGFEKTLEAVEKSGLVHAGAGRNLGAAAAPRYLETANGRVALIAVNSSFNPAMLAGEQSPRYPGRAGINGILVNTHIELPKDDLETIKRIAKDTKINAETEILRGEGYRDALPEDEAEFGDIKLKAGDTAKVVTKVNPKDLDRIKKSIYEAQFQADYIIISVHSHQLSGDKKESPSEFLREFAHFCIDNGANAVVGHGPHLLRPIEVYKECPIFYSLGDFILQLYSVESAPQDFFGKQNLSAATSTVHELLKKRSKGFTVGLMEDRRMFISVIPLWETEGGKLKKLTLLPIEMKMSGSKSDIGLPRASCDPEILRYLAEMSKPFGTEITAGDDGLLYCKW